MTTTTIEKLLVWAYREELAKRDFVETLGIGHSLDTASALGTSVSGGEPQWYAELWGGGIHDDALKVEQAVRDLKGLRLELDDPAVLVADMTDLADEVPGSLKRWRSRLDLDVMRHVKLGGSPDWRAEMPERKLVCDPRSGKPLWFVKEQVTLRAGAERWKEEQEVDGRDPKTHRPKPGAYRKHYWDPEPGLAIETRAEWLAYQLALDCLAESLVPHLTRWQLAKRPPLSLPWWPGRAHGARLVRPRAEAKARGCSDGCGVRRRAA